jgi:hypothetical protein
MEIISYKQGNHIIKGNTICENNGLRNQITPFVINANIEKVRIDDTLIVADGLTKFKTKHFTFYLTHLYEDQYKKIHCAGYYRREKEPYKDDNVNSSRFSMNICLITDIIL